MKGNISMAETNSYKERFKQVIDYRINSNNTKFGYKIVDLSDNGYTLAYNVKADIHKVSFDPNNQAWEILRTGLNKDKLNKVSSGTGFSELLKALARMYGVSASDPAYKLFQEPATKTIAEEFMEYENLWG
jgi:hypothetical protein